MEEEVVSWKRFYRKNKKYNEELHRVEVIIIAPDGKRYTGQAVSTGVDWAFWQENKWRMAEQDALIKYIKHRCNMEVE